ncbi:MAG: response regulator [Gammaproteobacteria bacterium]|nr:response regulator [Gammaproteobacteria bacterium]
MSNEAFILCVDDEPINIAIMEELLDDKYQLESVTSGRECLDIVSKHIPDLILLDVNMPGIDGLETCLQLRDNPETADIPVVFVSALATEAELMAGYHAGGDDYITKPFSEEILLRKIEIVLEAGKKKQKLQDITDSVVQTLITNQGNVSELNMVVNFLHDCFKQTEFHGLSKVVFNCLGRFELDSSLLFMTEVEALFWFSDDICRPMEEQILLSLNSQDRIVKFGTRLAINSSKATILIRNMPDDPDKVSRLTEYITIMIEGLDAKIKSMAVEAQLDQQWEIMYRTADDMKILLKAVEASDKKHKSRVGRMVARLGADIAQTIRKKELSNSQGKALVQVVKRVEVQTEKIEQDRGTARQTQESFLSSLIKSLKSV